MGRHRRLQVPQGLYHVTTRGNAGGAIYLDEYDRTAFLGRLGRTSVAHEWSTLAYCLMGNHFHLAIRTREANIAQGMRSLNGWYAQRFNARYDRTGHVFGGPYHAELVARDSHFLEVARYVVRNPVRAGLCQRPEDWPWSSYRATIGLEPAPAWLGRDELLAHFGSVENVAERYRAFVEDAVDRPKGTRPWTRSGDGAEADQSRDQVRGRVLLG